jgi:WD40 repeat protein
VQQESYKYWAFISYSHRDQAWAEWLHKALETYRVPRRLVGRETAAGPVPRRLFPVFRDLEELPSSPNLSGAIDQALLQSRYLIVIASPYAAVSKWVDQEILRFRAMGRDDRILCLIVDGEPNADLQPGKGFLECFPPPLRIGGGIEPIAADVRSGKDGRPAAKLKLIAGLLGVGLDELRRRERRRRIVQNLSWILFCLLSIALLSGLWQMQQHEKRRALDQQARRAHVEAVYEKGRQELLSHNQARAAVFLNEAYQLGVDTPALRFMLAQSMRIVDAQRLAFQTGAPVSDMKLSPDSRLMVTTGTDGVARVWDTSTGYKQFEFPLPQRTSSSGLIFSRDSQRIYFRTITDGIKVGSLYVWNARTGRLMTTINDIASLDRTFNIFDGDSRQLAYVASNHAVDIYNLDSHQVLKQLAGDYSIAGFSRDGRRLLTGGMNGQVTLWDASGIHKLKEFPGLTVRIVSLDDSEDGTLLAAAAQDGTVRVWHTADATLRMVGGHPSPNPGLIFNIDGTRLLTWAGDGIRIWNTANGALAYARQYIGGVGGNRVDISSSGRWVMTSSSARLLIQDTESGADIFTLDGHAGLPQARDISENDEILATGGSDGRVVLWNAPRIPDFEFLHSVDPVKWTDQSRPPGVAAVFSHNAELIATGAGDGQLKLWDAKKHQLIRSIEADPKSVNTIDFSNDDLYVATGGEIGGVKIWDVTSGRLLHAWDCAGKRVLTLSFNKDGDVVSAAIRGGITRLWDVRTGEQLASFERDDALSGRFSPDGKFYALGVHGVVKLWSIAQRKVMSSMQFDKPLDQPDASVSAIDFSPDGKQLVAAINGRVMTVFDIQTGQLLHKTLDAPLGQINTANLNHEGSLAVVSDHSGVAMLWRLSDGLTRILRGHAGEVVSGVFSADDAFALTSGVDGTAKIWDPSSGELLDTIAEHTKPMPEVPFQAASISPDGHWVLTGSVDGVIRLWALRKETRNAQQIEAILKCRVPWKLERESLVPSLPSPEYCQQTN